MQPFMISTIALVWLCKHQICLAFEGGAKMPQHTPATPLTYHVTPQNNHNTQNEILKTKICLLQHPLQHPSSPSYIYIMLSTL